MRLLPCSDGAESWKGTARAVGQEGSIITMPLQGQQGLVLGRGEHPGWGCNLRLRWVVVSPTMRSDTGEKG